MHQRKEEVLDSYLDETDKIMDGFNLNSIIEKSVELTLAAGEAENQNVLAAISTEEITLDHMKDITTHLEMIRSEEKNESAMVIARGINDSAREICDSDRFEFKTLSQSELDKIDQEINYSVTEYLKELVGRR